MASGAVQQTHNYSTAAAHGRTQALRSSRSFVRWFGGMLTLVFVSQLLFTTMVRAYVVPKLTPQAHWQFGIQKMTDSAFFHEEAMKLVTTLREQGWPALDNQVYEGLLHTKIVAGVYYLAGEDNPWWVYGLNAFMAAFSAALLFAFARLAGLSLMAAAALAGLLSTGPLYLFSHSELLREPFVVPLVLTFWIGLLVVARSPGLTQSVSGQCSLLLVGAFLTCIGFIGVSRFRPYLLLPMLLASVATLALSLIGTLVARAGWGVVIRQGLTAALIPIGLLQGYVRPQLGEVQQYAEKSVSSEEAEQMDKATAEQRAVLRKKIDATARLSRGSGAPLSARDESPTESAELQRTDLLVLHKCSVQWRHTPGVPAGIEAKLESLACGRQDFLRFCDPAFMGSRADRRCDTVNFASLGELLVHVPAAVAFGVLAPYPNMWLDDFGSGGSGVRRAGYVVDGVVAYSLIPGLLGLFFFSTRGRQSWELLALVGGLVVVLLVYSLGVPSQFILARMRLAFYLPLLILAAVGWGRLFDARRSV